MRQNWPEMRSERAGFSIATQRLTHLLRRIATDALRKFDLTFTEFELLAALRMQPVPHRLAPSALYGAMLMSSGGLTKLLKGLEARGLVLRLRATSDRRSLPVQLSDPGKRLIEDAMQTVQRAEAPVFEAMSAAWSDPASPTEVLLRLAEAAEATDLNVQKPDPRLPKLGS